jgi:replication factor C subunit 2/4
MPEQTRQIFDQLRVSADMPHLLIAGPSGSGKTTSVMALCRAKFGPNKLPERVTELNASDKRGINVVRTTIKNIASMAVGAADPDYPCPGYRIIILDEVDAMTNDAQSAMRKIMEDYSLTTRFILICNFAQQILQPIVSRCLLIQFEPVASTLMVRRMHAIASREKLSVSDEVLDTIAEHSEGDMRTAITALQNTRALHMIGKVPSRETVLEMLGLMLPSTVREMIQGIDGVMAAQQIAKRIELDALPIQVFLQALSELVIASGKPGMSDMLLRISTAEAELGKGASSYLQMMHLLTRYWYDYIQVRAAAGAASSASASRSKR